MSIIFKCKCLQDTMEIGLASMSIFLMIISFAYDFMSSYSIVDEVDTCHGSAKIGGRSNCGGVDDVEAVVEACCR